MKKSEKIIVVLDEELYECTVLKRKKEHGFFDTVYNVLNVAEKVAISLANLNKRLQCICQSLQILSLCLC